MRLILVGGNDLTFYLVKDLISKGYEVRIINSDSEVCDKMSKETRAMVISGDASNPAILEDAGAFQADILVALTTNDPDNLMICQVAKETFGVPKVLALLNNPGNEETFRRLGITSLFNVTQLLSILIQQNLATEDITNLLSVENGRVSIYQVVLEEGAHGVDQLVKDLDLPKRAVLGTILRNDDVLIPRGDTCLQAGDKILIISLPEVQAEVYQALIGRDE